MEDVKRKNKRNIVYLVLGILTLIISTAGATYAYFTATANNATTITGNMASISFDLSVTKMTTVDDNPGLIPMSNSMVEYAVANKSVDNKGICKDDNGNAVCQIYKITVENTGTASMLLDGYVTLTNGSGTATDLPTNYTATNATTMRWAQVFCAETNSVISSCTTAGITTTSASKSTNGVDKGITSGNDNYKWAAIQNTATTAEDSTYGPTGFNRRQILTSGVTTKAMIAGSEYDVINTNYIRISDHNSAATSYTQSADITSALIYNEFLNASDGKANNPAGGSSESYTDSQVYYIVVWLSETGTNQTITAAASREGFFGGVVKFISAQGSEVTGTFSGYTSVTPDTKTS